MPLVRYIVLAALVIWLGGTFYAWAGDRLRSMELVTYVCSGVMVAGLFVMKFVGPPPHDFTIRVAIVATIVGVTLAGRMWGRTVASAVTFTLGCVLLAWYARE